jgi:hypothetical protein
MRTEVDYVRLGVARVRQIVERCETLGLDVPGMPRIVADEYRVPLRLVCQILRDHKAGVNVWQQTWQGGVKWRDEQAEATQTGASHPRSRGPRIPWCRWIASGRSSRGTGAGCRSTISRSTWGSSVARW